MTRELSQAKRSVPEGCVSVELPMGIASGRSLSSGLVGGENRIRLALFKRMKDGACVGTVTFGEGAEGPPNHVHGGAVAYVLDEAMGSVAWMNDYPVVARKIDFEFLKMSPIGKEFAIEAKIVNVNEKRVFVEAKLVRSAAAQTNSSAEICVLAHGEFAILTAKKIAALDADKHDPKSLLKNPRLKWAPDK